jgi:hypothetical protein
MKLSCTLLVFAVFAESASCFSGCRRGVRVGGDHQAMGVRKLLPDGKTRGDYVWEDYISVFNRVRDIASGLKSLGFERVRFPSPTCAIFVIIQNIDDNLRMSPISALFIVLLHQGTKVGIYSINRPEWVISTQACNAMSFVSVPLYDTLGAFQTLQLFIALHLTHLAGPEAVSYIINQADIPLVICSADKLDKVPQAVSSDRGPCLFFISVFRRPAQNHPRAEIYCFYGSFAGWENHRRSQAHDVARFA